MQSLWKGLLAFWGIVAVIVVAVYALEFFGVGQEEESNRPIPHFKDTEEEMAWVSEHGKSFYYTITVNRQKKPLTLVCMPMEESSLTQRHADEAKEFFVDWFETFTKQMARKARSVRDPAALAGETFGAMMTTQLRMYERYKCLMGETEEE